MPGTTDPPRPARLPRDELWARIGITIQFLALIRLFGEVIRLNYVNGGGPLDFATARPYMFAGEVVALLCWIAVNLSFFRRFRLSAAVSAAAVVFLVACKLFVAGV